jgi:hypothetical protein
MDDGEIVPPVVAAPVAAPVPVTQPGRFICNVKTIERTCEAVELAKILDIVFASLGGIAVELTREEWQALDANTKRHFRAAS